MDFKRWDFVHHVNDKVNGLIVSDVIKDTNYMDENEYNKATIFWEDGIFSKSYSWYSGNSDEPVTKGKAFNIENAYEKSVNGVIDPSHRIDNLTYIEILDKLNEYRRAIS